MLQVQVSEIEKALARLLETLREREGEVVELPEADYYWAIAPEEMYAPYQKPETCTLGQLSDDLEEIGRIAKDQAPPVSLDFVKLSAVLAAIGYKGGW
jgi:hypothetical protein